ncbi:MAG: hypothetical protein QM831_06710 [Kofleriaceae bacterium]
MSRWQRYWFAEGGRYAVAIVRIAIAAAVLLTLARLDNNVSTGDVPGSHTLYRPVGIWMLLGRTPPPAIVVSALWVIAWTATVAMLAGFQTRISTAVSFVTALALASLSFASSTRWSHQYNVVFLAQCAFLGARGGDVLSIDALIRHRRGLPAIDLPRAYQWSLRLVQLAVAVMFACAAFHKIMHGHFTLRWAVSDNLRHQLLARFDLAGLPRPQLVNWIIDDPWKYRTVAVLNLISQAAPLLACFMTRHPLIRAFCGAFFLLETVALAFVVNLWNPHWLPLFAVFVDWDWLLRRPKPVEVVPPPTWQPKLAIRIWIVVFVSYDVLTALIPALDQKLNTYPFSGFPMFSTVLANEPYTGHSDYVIPGDHFEVTPAVDVTIQRWFDHSNRGMFDERDPKRLEARMRAMWAQAQRRYPDVKFERVRLYYTMFVAPAYPAPAHFDMKPIAIVGELSADGSFKTHVGPYPDRKPLGYYKNNTPVLIPFDGTLDGDPIVTVTEDEGIAWVTSSHADWRWQ